MHVTVSFEFSSIFAKIRTSNFSQGNVVTHWRYYVAFVGNLILVPAVEEVWNYVNNWQSYAASLVYHFYGTQCTVQYSTSQCGPNGPHDKPRPPSVCRTLGLTGPEALRLLTVDSAAVPVRRVSDKYAFQATDNEQTDIQHHSVNPPFGDGGSTVGARRCKSRLAHFTDIR